MLTKGFYVLVEHSDGAIELIGSGYDAAIHALRPFPDDGEARRARNVRWRRDVADGMLERNYHVVNERMFAVA